MSGLSLSNIRRLREIGRRARNAARFQPLRWARKMRRLVRSGSRLLRLPDKRAGVNLVAMIRADIGLGEAGRGVAAALDAANVPFSIINLQKGILVSHTNLTWVHKEVACSDHDVTVVSVNPDQSYNLNMYVPRSVLRRPYLIGNWYWELPRLPANWLTELPLYDEIWAPTRFIYEAVARDARVPVIHIPPVVEFEHPPNLPRAQFGLPDGRFLFLVMADTRSAFQRKNPLGAVQAFKTAFNPDDRDVGLVLKLNSPDFDQASFIDLQQAAEGWTNIYFLNRVLPRAEVNSLIAVCDCFVSLHRAEGFGLGPAEAMLLGKPAVVTNWSGSTDYMTAENCAAVDYDLVELAGTFGNYAGDQHWAEPDLAHAADWMRRLSADPHAAARIGMRGQQTIRTQHSAERVGKLITNRLKEIGLMT